MDDIKKFACLNCYNHDIALQNPIHCAKYLDLHHKITMSMMLYGGVFFTDSKNEDYPFAIHQGNCPYFKKVEKSSE